MPSTRGALGSRPFFLAVVVVTPSNEPMKPQQILVIAAAILATQNASAQNPSTNQALSMDGNGSYVSIPSSPLLQPANEITIEAWIYPMTPTTNPDELFVAKSDILSVSSARTYELDWNGNVQTLYGNLFLNTSTWASVSIQTPLNNWVHVAVTYNAPLGLLMLYTNGAVASATTVDASGKISLVGQTLRQTTEPLVFGGNPSLHTAFAHGLLDEVRIWNKARMGYEILHDFNRRLTGTETNLVAYWTFDDGTATEITTNHFAGSFSGNATTVADAATGPSSIARAVEIYLNTGFGSTFYQLQYATSAASTNWSNLSNPIFGNGQQQSLFDTTRGGPQRFYRVISY